MKKSIVAYFYISLLALIAVNIEAGTQITHYIVKRIDFTKAQLDVIGSKGVKGEEQPFYKTFILSPKNTDYYIIPMTPANQSDKDYMDNLIINGLAKVYQLWDYSDQNGIKRVTMVQDNSDQFETDKDWTEVKVSSK